MVVGVVFMVVFARSHEPKLSGGLIGAQEADFAGRMTRGGQKEKSAAACALHFDSKTLIALLEQQGVRFSGTQNMPIEPVRTFRGFVFDGIEEGTIVGGPGNTGDALDTLGKDGPGAQIFHLERELAESRGIGRISEQAIIFTDFQATQSKKRMAFCKQIQVE